MKKIFSHENVVTFVLVTIAVAVSALVVMPLIKKFVPAGLLPTAPATAPTTATPTA
ncbi:MAG: hypothetical protein ACRED1_01480 [Limisphaerales bacterium]